MEISESRIESGRGGVTVLRIKGRANVSAAPERLPQLVRERLEKGERRFIINLAECEWMDSAGLGQLITSLVTAIRRGGALKLASVPHSVRGLLTISNLTQVFETFDNEQAAIQSF
jgi:anti-sigma B factor antagonist